MGREPAGECPVAGSFSMGSRGLIVPWFSTSGLKFTLVGKKVASLHLQVGAWVVIVVNAYAPNGSLEYLPFSKSSERVLEGVPAGDSIVLLGDFNTQVGNDRGQ